jgi:hypothetical protein
MKTLLCLALLLTASLAFAKTDAPPQHPLDMLGAAFRDPVVRGPEKARAPEVVIGEWLRAAPDVRRRMRGEVTLVLREMDRRLDAVLVVARPMAEAAESRGAANAFISAVEQAQSALRTDQGNEARWGEVMRSLGRLQRLGR